MVDSEGKNKLSSLLTTEFMVRVFIRDLLKTN